MDEEIEVLNCTVRSVIYSNAENGYAVLSVTDTDGAEQKMTGILPYAWPGESITAYGHWGSHGSYGRQFEAESAERSSPEDERAVFAYLSSGAVKGIGPVTAGAIVAKFGKDALRILEEEPERLVGVSGISRSRAARFSEEFRRQAGLKKLVLFLSSCGIAPDYAIRMYRFYGDDSMEMLKENPYLLTEDGIGAPFGAADRLANELGIEDDDPNRIRSGILYVLHYNEHNGHCFIPYAKLLDGAATQLGLEREETEPVLRALMETGELVRETVAGEDACYLPDMYRAETETAARIAAMVQNLESPALDLERLIDDCEREQGIVFAPQQKEILRFAMTNRILAVTGGPGTGKTTSLKAILRLYDRMQLKTLLAAPTGRAAKRMTELTGAEAQTIHRLLGAQMAEHSQETVFAKNREDPLSCDALIVDECSMVDIRLMHSLLEALPKRARLILVGDAAQLPAVGPGDVFSSILRSEAVPSVRLTEIFRQQDGSRIVRNAHMINRGEHPDLSENTGDFFRLRRLKAGTVAETVTELCTTRLPGKMGIPSEEIQVLSPTRKGECGTAELNRALQAALNPADPSRRERELGEAVFREGDRVIQTRNDYNIPWETSGGVSGLGIYNGDIGILRRIDRDEQSVTVDYDGRLARYDFESMRDLEHAWALTVHKSQGSEYRAVILVLTDAAKRLLTRTVLYTAVTRARELLILVGDDVVAYRMIDNIAPNRRYNALRIRIREACGRCA
ncbi:MAG: ATP-dependent RecD-like DNA helicase [Oscillospiraceae bacterium]|nr:ATP-dependent RecD-like DNA helicase [Oscillospiraceae bacterium]